MANQSLNGSACLGNSGVQMKLVVPEGITLCKLVNFQGLAILEGRLLKYWVLYIIVALEPQEGRDIYRGTCTGFYPFPFFLLLLRLSLS